MTPELKQYLKQHKIDFTTIKHSPAYTASQIAQAAHVPGRWLAKVVVVKLDGTFAMAVLPASHRLDLAEIKQQSKAKSVEIAHEYEFKDKFPHCDLGAMPPVGELYDMDVYLADSLADQEWLAFNAGTHTELIQVKAKDFLKWAHPKSLHHC